MVINSTSISVYWDPPPLDDQNGVITGYTMNITHVNKIVVSIVINGTSFVASNLQEYEMYSFEVAAMTVIGVGPFSDIISDRTLQDGQFCL